MTKKEQARRKKIVKRSNKAIDKLNSKSKMVWHTDDGSWTSSLNRPSNIYIKEKCDPITDLERLKAFLEANEMPYEESVNDGVRPYIFVNFHKNGDAIDPC